MNELRKEIIKDSSDNVEVNEEDKAIVISGNYKEGIIGLIANNLVSRYHVPVIVFADTGEETLKGSSRAPEGYNIVELFNANSDLLVTFGGHAQAGGCSLLRDNFDEFKKRFIKSVENQEVIYEPQTPINLSFAEINFDNYELIQSFAPFGECWAVPIFKIKHIKTSELFFSKDGKHIIHKVSDSFKIIGFNFAKEKVRENSFINIIGTLRKGSYKGYYFIEFVISEIEPYN